MARATKFTKIEAESINLTTTTNITKTSVADATAAASSTPTKTEFDKVVSLVNDLKTKYNKLIDEIT